METVTKSRINITPKTIETAAPSASKIMQGTKDAMGFVPNMYEYMANNPALLDAYTHTYKTFRENAGFTSVEQEVIFLSVAYQNECDYCVAAHSFVADKMSGVKAEVTDAIRAGKDVDDAKLSALSTFTRLMTKTRANVSSEDISTFLSAGYNENHILGVITGIGVKTFSNYSNHLANTPLDDVFQERKWSK
tara:strand:+ start:570 stop:1145 length:576 start_codon:yes stop_codon:yes gene_type:complete